MVYRYSVTVAEADFDGASLQRELMGGAGEEGAIVTFTGYVRQNNDDRRIQGMLLEHYPGMTERSIESILAQAGERWQLSAAKVVHRVGELAAAEQIVWIGVASGHRPAAFSACEFIIDYLKTQAPFWKKERGPGGDLWVEAKISDEARARRWQKQANKVVIAED